MMSSLPFLKTPKGLEVAEKNSCRLLKKIQRRGARTVVVSVNVTVNSTNMNTLIRTRSPYPFAFILSGSLSPMRLANSAGEPMARDSGTMRALITMSPQIAAE